MRFVRALFVFGMLAGTTVAQGPGPGVGVATLDPPIPSLATVRVADCPKTLVGNVGGYYYYELYTCTPPVVTGFGALPAPLISPLPNCVNGKCASHVVGTNSQGNLTEGFGIPVDSGANYLVAKDKKYLAQVLPANQVIDNTTLNAVSGATVTDKGFTKAVSGMQTFYFRMFTIKIGSKTLHCALESAAPPAGTTVKDATFGEQPHTANTFKFNHRIRFKTPATPAENKWYLAGTKTERT